MDFLNDDVIEKFKKNNKKTGFLIDIPQETEANGSIPDKDIEFSLLKPIIPKHQKKDEVTHSKQKNHLEFLKKSLGDLENIRLRLGLSQRKMGELLMVDPSNWNRWVKRPETVPGSVYQSLHWYLQLRKLNITDQNVSYENFDSYKEQQKRMFAVGESLQQMHVKIDELSRLKRELSEENQRILTKFNQFKRTVAYSFGILILGFSTTLFVLFLLRK